MRLLLPAGVVALLTASASRADDAEDKVIAIAKKQGGNVFRDEEEPSRPIVRVYLFSSKVTDADLKELASLNNLSGLALNGTQLTDAGLRELARLKYLTEFALSPSIPFFDAPKNVISGENLGDLRKALIKCRIVDEDQGQSFID